MKNISQESLKDPSKFCKAGGVTNFRKIGIICEHENYDLPHVTGLVMFGELEVIAKNCVFCGRDCSEFFIGGIYDGTKV